MTTQLQFFTRTDETWNAMYEDCLKARSSIRFEQYLLNDDEIGNRFLDLFRKKAQEGVKVDLLLDGIGSRNVFSSPLIKEIREAGGIVNFYRPLHLKNIFFPSSWLPRNHCKTMIIDSSIVYIGGVCLAAFMTGWRDLHTRITGDLARFISGHAEYGSKASPEKNFRYAVSDPKTPHTVYKELLAEIESAQKSIYLVTPYFFPPKRLRRALKGAVRRGVDVRLMLSRKTDVLFAVTVSRSYFPQLIAMGVKILIYKESVIHAKYAVIDDKWATLGSTNFDYLSLIHNREANLFTTDPVIVNQLKSLFEKDALICDKAAPNFSFFLKIFFPLFKKIRKAF